jgi:mono/diheme cytochrome c family protein
MTMTSSRLTLAAMIAGLSGAGLFLSGCGESKAVAVDPAAKLARGKYLVENVGMCADCHTPRGPGGVFDQSRWLQGSVLGFAPTVPMPAWAEAAPPIAGLPAYTDEQALAFLTTGKTISGQPLRPPMPPYRFNTEDAEAVLVYLRSLK